MRIVDRRHLLALASIVLGAAVAMLIASAGTTSGYESQAAAEAPRMTVPF